MVFLHGGGFCIGTGSEKWYHGDSMVSANYQIDYPTAGEAAGDTIFVTLNYRLGPLGFLMVPGNGANGANAVGLAGNGGMNGIMDQVLASILCTFC